MPGGYETSGEHILPWSFASARLEEAQNYWLATVRPAGTPHVTPIWGVWHDGALYFTGIPTATWAKNIARNPGATIHLESGSEVVIAEGWVEDIPSIVDTTIADVIVRRWTEKYQRLVPDPIVDGMYCLHAHVVRGWSTFPTDATRWVFES